VVLDLEDAVEPSDETAARRSVAEWASSSTAPHAVRINAVGTSWHDADLEALAGHPVLVVLPKAEDPVAVAEVLTTLPDGSAVIALVETALGVLRAADLARIPGVARLALGTYDLGAELGVDPDHSPAFAGARTALVLASAAGRLPGPIDGVTGDVRDADRLVADISTAAAVGFTGKLCIHPAQVGPAAAALAPRADEVAWAERVLAAVARAEQGVVLVDGRMVDRPVITRAQRILSARSTSHPTPEKPIPTTPTTGAPT
jgi:citrate lyase subunit beta/citryl-CoA lyase